MYLAAKIFTNAPTYPVRLSAAVFRVILADFDKVAYIDCDVSPLTDLGPLIRMVANGLARHLATYDLVQMFDDVIYDRLPLVEKAGYLQSGVMVLDLKAIREERILKEPIQFALEIPRRGWLIRMR